MAPSHSSSTRLPESLARDDPRRTQSTDCGSLGLSLETDSAALREGRDVRARTPVSCTVSASGGRGETGARGVGAEFGRAPQEAPGAYPRSRFEHATTSGTSLTGWNIKITYFRHTPPAPPSGPAARLACRLKERPRCACTYGLSNGREFCAGPTCRYLWSAPRAA